MTTSKRSFQRGTVTLLSHGSGNRVQIPQEFIRKLDWKTHDNLSIRKYRDSIVLRRVQE